MVNYPPLAPSVRWFSFFFKALSEGKNENEAIEMANESISSTKEFARYSLKDNNGEPMILTIPVEGGGKRLKKIETHPELYLSEHGDWRKVHLGGLEATLGRTPFYRYIEPDIKGIYQNKGIVELEKYNKAIFLALKTFLMGNLTPDKLVSFLNDSKWQKRGLEIAEQLDFDVSVLQPFAEFGRETLLGIMIMDCN